MSSLARSKTLVRFLDAFEPVLTVLTPFASVGRLRRRRQHSNWRVHVRRWQAVQERELSRLDI